MFVSKRDEIGLKRLQPLLEKRRLAFAAKRKGSDFGWKADIARDLGCDSSFVGHLYNGDRGPSSNTLRAAVRVFDLPVDYFTGPESGGPVAGTAEPTIESAGIHPADQKALSYFLGECGPFRPDDVDELEEWVAHVPPSKRGRVTRWALSRLLEVVREENQLLDESGTRATESATRYEPGDEPVDETTGDIMPAGQRARLRVTGE